MKTYIRFSIFFLLIFFTCGSPSSPASAGSSGQHLINKIKNNPCGELKLKPGGTYSLPEAVCKGYKGKSATINVPVRGWDINPEYPFVNTPFFVGTGTYLDSVGIDFEPKGTIKWPGRVKITNYKTEVRLVPYGVTGAFNGRIRGDSSMHLGDVYSSDKYKGRFHADISLAEPELSSVGDLDNEYYGTTTKSNLYTPGVDTAILVLTAFSSSYHAENPSTYKGEPAYRLEVTSHYVVEAKVSWQYYEFWEWKQVGEVTVCSPGTNSEGLYECFVNPGEVAWNGHYTTQPAYDWVWGDKREEGGGTGWVPIHTVSTNLVRWPDDKNHDHIPILVYQSQPLLQKP